MGIKSQYTFLPWMRTGLAAQVSGAVNHRGTTRLRLNMSARKKDLPAECTPFTIEKEISVYGPGDVTGFDPNIVVRTDPKNGVNDFEPNYFPALEFADPDFPWRYSLYGGNDNFLRPWITLIALVAETRGSRTKEFEDQGCTDHNSLMPRIKVQDTLLPELTYCWRWAHIQVVTESEGENETLLDHEQLAGLLESSPELFVSRLICARKLVPGTLYNAFVVPTYEIGRRAALGWSFDNLGPQEFSWQNNNRIIELPYYYKWEFRTGLRGNFEHLVRQLKPRQLKNLGLKPVDCSKPGLGVRGAGLANRATGSDTIKMEGALRSADTSYSNWGHDKTNPVRPEPFQLDIAAKVLNRNTSFLKGYYLEAGSREYGDLESLVISPAGKEDKISIEIKCPTRRRVTLICERIEGVVVAKIEALEYKRNHTLKLENLELNRAYNLKLILNDQAGKEIKVKGITIEIPLMPYVTPPLYGSWHKAEYKVDPGRVNWFNTLNCDPRHRLAAGLGARFIRKEKETLMTSAWDQLGDVLKANALLQRAQLSRAASKGVEKKISKIKNYNEELYLKITGPAMKHVRCELPGSEAEEVKKERTIYHHLLGHSHVPVQAVGDAYRRLSNRGSLQKKAEFPFRGCFNLLMSNPEALLKKRIALKGAVEYDEIGAQAAGQLMAAVSRIFPDSLQKDKFFTLGPQDLEKIKEIKSDKFGSNITIDPNKYSLLKSVLTGFSGYLAGDLNKVTSDDFSKGAQWLNPAPGTIEKEIPEDILVKTAIQIEKLINPSDTVKKRVMTRIELPRKLAKARKKSKGDDFGPIMVAPHFDQPLYESLLELSQDYFLPGIETISQNTIGLLATNNRFIESFLVGCNHEFSAELLWRKYPTDQRGSYFRQFWDSGMQLPPDGDEGLEEEVEKHKDIKEIHTWWSSLGNNSLQGNAGQVILIIRGDLIKKYPNTVIYTVDAAVEVPDDAITAASIEWNITSIELPQFSGSVPPDITLLGFSFDEAAARKKFFVIEEIVSETRFGLNITSNENPEELSWEDFGIITEHDNGKYINRINAGSTRLSNASNSAVVAAKTFRKPLRIVIHGNSLLPRT